VSSEIVQYAKYPFTKGAREYVQSKGVSLLRILTSGGYEQALERAVERVREAVSSHCVSGKSVAKSVFEIYSYPVARVIVSLLGEEGIIKYYARAEAKRMSQYLKDEEDKHQVVLWILKELGVDFSSGDEGEVLIPIPQYLAIAPSHDDYKLVNQVLGKGITKGNVIIRDDNALIDIAENAFRLKIEEELPLNVDEETRDLMMPYMQEISQSIYQAWVRPVEEKGEVILEAIPPCMHALLDAIQQGGEITHQGRFALTSFLCAIGLNTKQIIELYSRRPDFRYDLTKYQVEHISGNISSTRYTPPECSTMRTYGLCTNMDMLCQREWMKHPLIYYRVKKRDFEEKK